MLLRQLFDEDTYTYTYLLADEVKGKAALIDPVLGKVGLYLDLLDELSLQLMVALDTHVHADHITALGRLRELTECKTYLGNKGDVSCADNFLANEKIISIGRIDIKVLYTPGHTDDSYCFLVNDQGKNYVFTGDTLLIRGSGRTDFQNGDARQLYQSLHQVLMNLPPETIVYPGHDYRGMTMSTIAEEQKHNPRIKLESIEEFETFMKNLKLPNPKWMDIAVPANRSCGNQ